MGAPAQANGAWRCSAAGPLRGELTPPGDKSISHRALMLGAVARGVTEITGFLAGADCLATRDAVAAMGVQVDTVGADALRVHGVGPDGLRPPPQALDLGNSGTSMRLLAGLLAGQGFDSILTGDDSLRRRPMERIAAPLALMGASVGTENGRAPLHIRGGRTLNGIEYRSPVASAQIKSALLLAGLYARGETAVIEPGPSRDHTERMLRAFGCPVAVDGRRVALTGPAALRAAPVAVPADFSAAAFFIVAASVTPGSRILLRRVGINPTRTGLLDILQAMGARIELRDRTMLGGEPVADIAVAHGALRGIDIPPALVPRAIDEFPALFVVAALAEGETRVTGAAELRHKESDRIAVMADNLLRLGATVQTTDDGACIRGGRLGGGSVDSGGDHRVAMAFAAAAAAADGPIEVRDVANVATSFPGFPAAAARLGMAVQA